MQPHVVIAFSLLALLAVSFGAFFLWPTFKLSSTLKKVNKHVAHLKKGPEAMDALAAAFKGDAELDHLWQQYAESLHHQTGLQGGQVVTQAVRSTAQAEAFFHPAAIIDNKTRAELFKHLPGVLTGVGIIGTFLGLVFGLQAFHVSDDPTSVRKSLEILMASVSEAFSVSGTAIGLAMAVTVAEKLGLSVLHAQVDTLCRTIDSLFESGAGEEYLADLAKSAGSFDSQLKQLKDSIVNDLKQVLVATARDHAQHSADLTQRQIDASRVGSQELARAVSGSIEQSFRKPLEDIAGAVRSAAGEQSSSAVGMLEDVMASFSQKLSDLFGGQISSINDANRLAAENMQDAVRALQTLAGDLGVKNTAATESFGDVIQRLAEQQTRTTATTEKLLAQMAATMDASSSAVHDKLMSSVEKLAAQSEHLTNFLVSAQQSTAAAAADREERLVARGETAAAQVNSQVEKTCTALTAAAADISKSVQTLQAGTTDMLAKLETAATAVNGAAVRFAESLKEFSRGGEQAKVVGDLLSKAGADISRTSEALRSTMTDFNTQQSRVTEMVAVSARVVEKAGEQADKVGTVVAQVERAAERLEAARIEVDAYLDGVSQALAGSTRAFEGQLTTALSTANSKTLEQFAKVAQYLHTCTQELSGAVEELSSALTKRKA